FDRVVVRTLDVANAAERERIAACLPRIAGTHTAVELGVEGRRHGRAENEEPDPEMRETHSPRRTRQRRARAAASERARDGIDERRGDDPEPENDAYRRQHGRGPEEEPRRR